MRDLIKKEKVLRSESKLQDMANLIGPKGRVCLLFYACSYLGEWVYFGGREATLSNSILTPFLMQINF